MAILSQLHASAQPALFSGPTPSFPLLESDSGWYFAVGGQGTFGPRTTRPGGQLVLGLHVQGDSWSGGTRGPPTPCSFSECVKSFLLCILFGWFLSVPSLHALVFIWKTSL